jgi:hypothetical protein
VGLGSCREQKPTGIKHSLASTEKVTVTSESIVIIIITIFFLTRGNFVIGLWAVKFERK